MILAQLLGRQRRAKIPVPLADDRHDETTEHALLLLLPVTAYQLGKVNSLGGRKFLPLVNVLRRGSPVGLFIRPFACALKWHSPLGLVSDHYGPPGSRILSLQIKHRRRGATAGDAPRSP